MNIAAKIAAEIEAVRLFITIGPFFTDISAIWHPIGTMVTFMECSQKYASNSMFDITIVSKFLECRLKTASRFSHPANSVCDVSRSRTVGSRRPIGAVCLQWFWNGTLALLISVPERVPVFGPYAGRHGRQLACQLPKSKIRHGY